MAKLLTHQIRVETEEENVTVMIGNDGGVPGGFAKLFNRVLDCGAGRASPTPRAPPTCRSCASPTRRTSSASRWGRPR